MLQSLGLEKDDTHVRADECLGLGHALVSTLHGLENILRNPRFQPCLRAVRTGCTASIVQCRDRDTERPQKAASSTSASIPQLVGVRMSWQQLSSVQRVVSLDGLADGPRGRGRFEWLIGGARLVTQGV